MSRKPGQKRSHRSSGSLGSSLSQVKLFRPLSWYERVSVSPAEYVSHLLQELGRLGLEITDIERHDRPAQHANRAVGSAGLAGWGCGFRLGQSHELATPGSPVDERAGSDGPERKTAYRDIGQHHSTS